MYTGRTSVIWKVTSHDLTMARDMRIHPINIPSIWTYSARDLCITAFVVMSLRVGQTGLLGFWIVQHAVLMLPTVPLLLKTNRRRVAEHLFLHFLQK